MLRKPLAMLVASAMVLSSGAFAAPDAGQQPPTNTAKNEAPLSPGGAAGIEKAQADDDTALYIIGGVILLGGVLALLLVNNGHHSGQSGNTPSTPSTH